MTVSDHDSLLLALRTLQLPIESNVDTEVLESLIEYAESASLLPDDLAIEIQEGLRGWGSTGEVSSCLNEVMDLALQFTPALLESLTSRQYLDLYSKLRKGSNDSAGISHTKSRRLLSRFSLIAHLLQTETFSCSQIARMLKAVEPTLDVSYGAVQILARYLSLRPSLTQYEIGEVLWEQDSKLSTTLFPDSSLEESNSIAGDEAQNWLPEVDFSRLLSRLSGVSLGKAAITWPYLQILHWCLVPIEKYDHPASYLYEFSPRGQVALALFSRYEVSTGNPILNNAKAVETLNMIWARNRGGDDAHALAEILQVLDSLPFIQRRQVARVLRGWLIRVIELCTVVPTNLDTDISHDAVLKMFEFICKQETNTQGVIEQRTVDCLAVLALELPGWRARGLGDSVNASNLSRKKLGDVEFVNVDERKAIALEAHGGFLSQTYVRDHQRSLARGIEQRLEDSWASLDDPASWTVEVLFVAHSWEESGLPESECLHGVNVTYKYVRYEKLLLMAIEGSNEFDRIKAFQLHVIQALNKTTVRETARAKYRSILF